jgi:GT2 family glycosyltransferase/glycosyltransferase involved in cell wall biosynthesis
MSDDNPIAGAPEGAFANLRRRAYLTYRYFGLRTILYRLLTFPLRFTPLGRRLRLRTHLHEQELRRAIAWYREQGRPVDIVVPSYRDSERVRALARSIRKTVPRGMARVIVADDASGPEHIAALRQLKGIDILVESERNTGFAANVNRGLRASATDRDVVVLNSDVEALPNWLQCLQYAAHRDEDIGIVGAQLLYPDGRIQFGGTVRNRDAPEWFDHRYRFKPADWGPAAQIAPALAVTGACMYVRRETIERVGPLDERYPMAYEDVDWCLRAWQAGYRVLYFPPARLIHHESVTRGTDVGERERTSQRLFWERWSGFFDARSVRADAGMGDAGMGDAGMGDAGMGDAGMGGTGMGDTGTADAGTGDASDRRPRIPRASDGSGEGEGRGRLRIAYVTEGTGVGGGHRDIFEHLNRLAARGHEVSLYTLGDPPDWFPLRVPAHGFEDYEELVAALAPLEAIKVATWWNTAAPVWLASVLHGIPVYFVQDIETSYYPDHERARHAVLDSYRPEFRYMTISAWNRERLRELGLDAELIPPGIDLDTFGPRADVVRREDMVLALGRSNPLKNLPLTLDAWRALAAPRPELCLFGIEPELATDPGMRHVQSPDDEQVNELFCQASVFVQTSTHEGFALPPLEAMATGCAVVCTDAHGNRDFCVDGVNCLMPESDPTSVSAALARLLADPELRARLGQAGIETAQEYAWELRIDALEGFFEGVAEPRRMVLGRAVVPEVSHTAQPGSPHGVGAP